MALYTDSDLAVFKTGVGRGLEEDYLNKREVSLDNLKSCIKVILGTSLNPTDDLKTFLRAIYFRQDFRQVALFIVSFCKENNIPLKINFSQLTGERTLIIDSHMLYPGKMRIHPHTYGVERFISDFSKLYFPKDTPKMGLWNPLIVVASGGKDGVFICREALSGKSVCLFEYLFNEKRMTTKTYYTIIKPEHAVCLCDAFELMLTKFPDGIDKMYFYPMRASELDRIPNAYSITDKSGTDIILI